MKASVSFAILCDPLRMFLKNQIPFKSGLPCLCVVVLYEREWRSCSLIDRNSLGDRIALRSTRTNRSFRNESNS